MRCSNEKGVALVFTLFISVILYALGGMFVLRAIHENNMARVDRELSKAFYAADTGTQAGLDQLDTLINNYLLNTVSNANPNLVINYTQNQVNAGDGIGWLTFAVRNNNTPVLTANGDQAEYTQNGTIPNAGYEYTIIITEKEDPIDAGPDMWDFPFNFRIESVGTADDTTREVVLHGDFTVRVQRDNFAKYALFTNEQETQSGSYVWFTDQTNFAGPLHTNARFNFALNPSGTFEAIVKQAYQYARFYNNGSYVLLNDDANGTTDVPTFLDGFQRDQDTITLSSPSQKQDMVDQVTGGQNFGSSGIYVPSSSGSCSGGIYINGSGTVSLGVDASNNAQYTVTQGGETRIITVDTSANQTTVANPNTGTQTSCTGLPDGVDDIGTLIYVDGDLDSLSGTVQENTELTIASDDDIVITDHVQYSNFTPASGTPGDSGYVPPHAQGAANLLGLVSWDGDVQIGTSAPDDINIHATVLAQSGVLEVVNHNSGSPRGTATLLGGVITDNYGAFGTFNGATGQQVSGYGRNFVYDERMEGGSAPPYFPSLNTFIAFTNDITDKLVWHEER